MKFGLICSQNLKPVLLELLNTRGISPDDTAEVFIVEAGMTPPEGKLSLVFSVAQLNLLISFLDAIHKPSEEVAGTILGKTALDRYEIVPYERILFFEGRGNDVYCLTSKGEFRVKEKLYELETRLPQKSFVLVSKSFIVNILNVSEIIPWFDRRLILRFNESKLEVEVSRSHVKKFKSFLRM